MYTDSFKYLLPLCSSLSSICILFHRDSLHVSSVYDQQFLILLYRIDVPPNLILGELIFLIFYTTARDEIHILLEHILLGFILDLGEISL